MLLCICACGGRALARQAEHVCVCGSEDNSVESLLFYHYVGTRDQSISIYAAIWMTLLFLKLFLFCYTFKRCDVCVFLIIVPCTLPSFRGCLGSRTWNTFCWSLLVFILPSSRAIWVGRGLMPSKGIITNMNVCVCAFRSGRLGEGVGSPPKTGVTEGFQPPSRWWELNLLKSNQCS